MTSLKARVKDGRLVLDEPTELPEGTEVELLPADASDDLDDEDRRRLHEAIARSAEEARSGRVVPAEEVLRKLRRA